MSQSSNRRDEVEQLLLNAKLRDELEPFLDEAVDPANTCHMPTHLENEYLASMLEWERAPVLPISRWFQPELVLPPHDELDDATVHDFLWEAIEALHDQQIVLDFTDHLSDRELYCLIARDILPSLEKKLKRANTFLHWQCIDLSRDPELWLRYYATPDERESWQAEFGARLPECATPPYPRKMPGWRS